MVAIIAQLRDQFLEEPSVAGRMGDGDTAVDAAEVGVDNYAIVLADVVGKVQIVERSFGLLFGWINRLTMAMLTNL